MNRVVLVAFLLAAFAGDYSQKVCSLANLPSSASAKFPFAVVTNPFSAT